MIIRALKENDFYYGSGFLETLDSLHPTASYGRAKLVFRKCKAIGKKTFVAVAHVETCPIKIVNGNRSYKNLIVGTASLLIEPKYRSEGGEFNFAAHLEDVAVHKDWQGHGIGKWLVRHAIEYARKASCYKIVLCCKPNLEPFYGSLGFLKHEVGMRLDLREAEVGVS